MSGINHITGGTIFTGLFASFWNINIFSKPEYLILCILASILPDIDHTKSPIGKLAYPLARYLDRHFGHRTLTHSLLCFIPLILLSTTLEKLYSSTLHLTLIFTFSYASHLIFDMMTKEGVPLLYPFNKNPCVIPGNPALRLRSGDFKTEATIFCLLIPIALSCKPLFENGFWTTLNRTFGTLKHLHQEFLASPQLIELSYQATHLGKTYQGEGYLIYTTPQKAIIFDSNFLEINQNFQITQLLPTRTQYPYTTQEHHFQNITPDGLQALLHDKPLLALHIQANTPIQYTQGHKPCTSTQVDLAYTYNPQLIWSSNNNDQEDPQIQLLKHELQILQKETALLEEKQNTIKRRITEIIHAASQMNAYTRQRATEELKNLRKELDKVANTQQAKKIEELTFRIEQLQKRPEPSCSGYIQYLELPRTAFANKKMID